MQDLSLDNMIEVGKDYFLKEYLKKNKSLTSFVFLMIVLVHKEQKVSIRYFLSPILVIFH